jgi:predicted esterase
MAGYSCVVNSPGAGPVDLVVIVLHGYGASNDNFSPFPSLFGPGRKTERARGSRGFTLTPLDLSLAAR